ncbi:MAG: class I SAM-dependent methyltransferase [Woeseia sp.]
MHESDFAAAQAFLLGAKNFWTTNLYRELRYKYDRRIDKRDAESLTPDEAVAELEGDVTYHFFGWLERHLQRMKYTSRYGVIPYHSERRDTLTQEAGFSLQDEYAPVLNPGLELPKYYKSIDIHQHQGGLWSEITAGFAYEYGARTTTPLLGETHEDLHKRFTEYVADGVDFKRILDLGCGFGKSTRPFLKQFPTSAVHAVDLSAPCLHVASQFARKNSTRNVRYSQQDARGTNFDDESFDLVTSTMLLHELPVKSVLQLFEECYRLLQHGGRMAHLDFYILPDAFDRLMHYGHSKRNNEIFMRGVSELDLPGVLGKIGFIDIKIERFQEGVDVDLDAHEAWRFPWTAISAVKPRRAAA